MTKFNKLFKLQIALYCAIMFVLGAGFTYWISEGPTRFEKLTGRKWHENKRSESVHIGDSKQTEQGVEAGDQGSVRKDN